MKKHGIVLVLSAVLTLSLCLSLSGCGKDTATDAAELFGEGEESESITPTPPVLGGGESMGPLYTPYSFEEADSAGLTSPVFPSSATKGAPDADAQSPEAAESESAETSGGSVEGAASATGAESATSAVSGTDAVSGANASASGTPDASAASDAYKQGYAAGEAAGYAQGYKAGYDEGGGVGYNNGYKAGRTAGYAEIAGIVTSRIADNTD